jgi:hypothetical protein
MFPARSVAAQTVTPTARMTWSHVRGTEFYLCGMALVWRSTTQLELLDEQHDDAEPAGM